MPRKAKALALVSMWTGLGVSLHALAEVGRRRAGCRSHHGPGRNVHDPVRRSHDRRSTAAHPVVARAGGGAYAPPRHLRRRACQIPTPNFQFPKTAGRIGSWHWRSGVTPEFACVEHGRVRRPMRATLERGWSDSRVGFRAARFRVHEAFQALCAAQWMPLESAPSQRERGRVRAEAVFPAAASAVMSNASELRVERQP